MKHSIKNETMQTVVLFFHFIFSVHSGIVDCVSGQGRKVFETAGVAALRPRISKTRERRYESQDAIYGWTLKKPDDK